MPADLNYKKKYLELRAKYISDLDMAFRLGFEDGQQASQQQQALDAQAKVQESEQKQALAEAGGMSEEGQPPSAPGEENQHPGEEGQQPPQPGSEGSNGSELDQHINKLESMLGSSEQSPEIKKSLEAILSLRKDEKLAVQLKKSEKAAKGIVSTLHKPQFKMGAQAQHNMTDNSKRTLSLQHKIVSDVMKAWKEEETKASSDIKSILDVESFIKD